VEGEGVIGQQPVIEPGGLHHYVSGSILPTTIGKMEGYYTMIRTETGESFQVRIPAFLLITPYRLN